MTAPEPVREVSPAVERVTRLPALEGLRGVAALVVLVRHWWETVFPLAWEGREWLHGPLAPLLTATGAVHLFFVLSGVVLTGSLERGRGGAAVAQYGVRRVFRLYPPFIVAVLFSWIASFFYLPSPPGSGVTNLVRMLSGTHFTFDQVFPGLLILGPVGGVLPVGWSLAIEGVFSALLPAMVALARRFTWTVLLVGPILALWIPGSPAHLLHLRGLLLCSFDFGLGVGLWLERERLARWVGGHQAVALALAVVGAFLLGWPTAGRWGIHLPPAVVSMALGAAALVVAALHFRPLRRVLESAPILFVGRVSYSLYLLHLAVLILLAPRIVRHGGTATEMVLLLALVLAVSLLLSFAAWQWIERPAIAAGNRVVHLLARRLGVAERLSRR